MENRHDVMKIFWIFLGVIIVLIVAAVTLSIIFGRGYGTGSYGYGMMGWGGAWAFGGILMIIPVILFFLFIYWIVSIASEHHHPLYINNSSSPTEILKTRYARGEISKEEYDRMINDINSK